MSKDVSFEVQLSELEQLVRKLEQSDLPLEQALVAFEQGNKLVKACREQLERVEMKVEQILRVQEEGEVGGVRPTARFDVE